MDIVWEYRFLLLQGLWVTVKVSVLAALVAIVLSLIAGIARDSGFWPVRWLAAIYVEFFRGTSLLAQLFWLFFVLPAFGISLSALACGVLGLGLCNGAYGSELVRGALRSVPRSQREAAVAMNFSRWQTLRLVVMPQAAIVLVPLYGNLCVELLKASALVSLITLPDLTFQAKNIILVHVNTAPVLSTVLVVYFALALVISWSASSLERKLAQGRNLTMAR